MLRIGAAGADTVVDEDPKRSWLDQEIMYQRCDESPSSMLLGVTMSVREQA